LAAALSPLSAIAQSNQAKLKLAYVHPGRQKEAAPLIDAIVSGVRASGYPVQQLELVVRSTENDPTRIGPLVAEIVNSRVAAIVAGGPAVLRAVRAATQTIPILASDLESDPVAAGFAASLARPGGNLTGVFLDFPDFAAKWIEFLVESIPGLARIAVVWDSATGPVQVDAVRKAASDLKLLMEVMEVSAFDGYGPAFSLANQHGAQAAILPSSPLVFDNAARIADLALRHRLPTITMFPNFARTGGLLAYGPDLPDLLRQIGAMAGKVLRGQDVAQLPIERPTKFELVINMKTAKALGLTISPSILARADEVIE